LLHLLARRLSARASPAWVFGPLRDITRAQPPNRDDSHAVASFRPQAFTAFRRLPPRSGLQAYFIPQPRPGSLPFRGFSSRAATLPLRKELPPGRCSATCSPTFAGCRTRRTSALRPSSARDRVRYSTVIHHAARRSPPRVRLLQARTSLGRSHLTCDLRSRRFSRCAFASAIALRARPQRLSQEKPGVASPLRPPARAFEPSSKSPCS